MDAGWVVGGCGLKGEQGESEELGSRFSSRWFHDERVGGGGEKGRRVKASEEQWGIKRVVERGK